MKTLCAAACSFSILLAPLAAQEPAATGGPAMLSDAFSPEALEAQRLAEFESLLDAAAETDDFVGLAVAVVRRGRVELLKTYGVRDIATGAPVTANTVFRVGSLSKGFASSLAGLAVAEGAIALDTPVSPYAPGLALKGGGESRLTVGHILSHRTGLPPNAYDNLLEAGREPSDILPRYRSVSPICSVGSCYAYQNIAYDLIAPVLEGALHEPYDKLVRTRIFAPLGMNNASLGMAGLIDAGDWARPHIRDRDGDLYGPWSAVPVKEPYYRTPAAGGVNASITDMARWLAAQMGRAPEVLPWETVDLIHTPQVETPAELRRWRELSSRLRRADYGLGWRIYDYAGNTLINHSGTVEGYAAQIAWLPEKDVGIVVLSNARAKRLWRILPTFFDMELGLPDEDWFALNESGEDAAFAGSR